MSRKRTADRDEAGNGEKFISRICTHPLLTDAELSKLVFIAQRGRWARSVLITRNLRTLITVRKKDASLSVAESVHALLKVLDRAIAKHDTLTTEELVRQVHERAQAIDGTSHEGEERIDDIDGIIAEVVPLKRLPELYAHYQNAEEQIALVVAALRKPKGPALTKDEEFAVRMKFLDKLHVRNPSAEDVQRVITLAWGSFVPLSKQRTATLMEEVRAGYTAADEIIRCNGRLATKMARMFRSHLPIEDRIIAGQYGIMRALYRFEPARGFRFSTYASWWLKHSIRRIKTNEGRTIRIPVHQEDVLHRLKKLMGSSEEMPDTDAAIAKRIRTSAEKIRELRPHLQPLMSLDAPVHGNDDLGDMTLANVVPDESETPEEALLRERRKEFVQKLIADIPDKLDRDIILRRYGISDANGDREEETLKEVGDSYNLSRERIRQRQAEALNLLRERLQGAYDAGEI